MRDDTHRRVRRRAAAGALLLTLAAGWLVVLATPAGACSCGQMSEAAAFDAADVAFVGTLDEVRVADGVEYSSSDPARYVFSVERVYKGEAMARQSVVTARSGASCGLELSGAGPFLVFATVEPDGLTSAGIDGELYANLCGGSRPVDPTAAPTGFGTATEPTAGSSPIGEPDDGGIAVTTDAVVGLVALAALGAAGWLLWRGRRAAR